MNWEIRKIIICQDRALNSCQPQGAVHWTSRSTRRPRVRIPLGKRVGVKTSILSLELFLPFFFSGRKFSWRWVHTYLNISHPSLSLSHSLMHTHTLTLFLSLKYTYCTLASHILSHEALDSPSHSHTRSHTHTNSQPHTCIHMHSLSHTLPVFHFIRYPERMLGAHSRSLISASVWSTTIP